MPTLLSIDRGSSHHKKVAHGKPSSSIFMCLILNPTMTYNKTSSKYKYCPKPIVHKHEPKC